jgi:hypothetical protein
MLLQRLAGNRAVASALAPQRGPGVRSVPSGAGAPASDPSAALDTSVIDGELAEVVIEPTGPAGLPVAVFFAQTGDVVYRVSS